MMTTDQVMIAFKMRRLYDVACAYKDAYDKLFVFMRDGALPANVPFDRALADKVSDAVVKLKKTSDSIDWLIDALDNEATPRIMRKLARKSAATRRVKREAKKA